MKTITRASVLTALAGAAAGSLSRPAWGQTKPTLRIGVMQIDDAAEPRYASELGYFTDAGLDVAIQDQANSPTIVAGIVAGALDIGYTTIDSMASMHSHGIPIVVIAPSADYLYPQSLNITGILVRPDSPIRTAKDLNGKTIGVPGLHGLGTTAMSSWIDQNGGDSSTVKYVEIPFPAGPAALDQGRVDAMNEVAPFFGAAAKQNRILTAGYNSIAKHFQSTLWVAQREWAVAHPDLVSRFASVIRRTAVWANKHHAESGAILAKNSKIPADVIATMVRAHYAEGELTPTLLQPGIEASAKYNVFKSFPASELIFSPKS